MPQALTERPFRGFILPPESFARPGPQSKRPCPPSNLWLTLVPQAITATFEGPVHAQTLIARRVGPGRCRRRPAVGRRSAQARRQDQAARNGRVREAPRPASEPDLRAVPRPAAERAGDP